MTLLLDNFEDNLSHDGTGWTVLNEELAGFLTAWIRLRGRHKLLITSRHPFPSPNAPNVVCTSTTSVRSPSPRPAS